MTIRTIDQLRAAPEGAIFVCDDLTHARELRDRLGRVDVTVLASGHHHLVRGGRPIVLDHVLWITASVEDLMAWQKLCENER